MTDFSDALANVLATSIAPASVGPLVEALRRQSAPVWTRAQVVAEAREWLGTPYHHGQRTKGIGCDCIGVPGGVGLAVGFPSAIAWANDQEFKGYGPDPDREMLLRACHKYLVPIAISDAGLADIFLMCWERRERIRGEWRVIRDPHHFGLVSRLDPTYIIHAYTVAGMVCETSIEGYWRQRIKWRDLILSAWRYRELS